MANRVALAVSLQQRVYSEPVGIFLEQEVERIAAMLGVLKAGGYFVLLDPALPSARIATILADSGATHVIGNERTGADLRMSSGISSRFIAFEGFMVHALASHPRQGSSPSDYSYIAYTSGSLGQPKAIIQTHRSLLHRVMLHVRVSDITCQDRVAHLTSGTSNAITTAFYALLNGATLCPFDVKKYGVDALAGWLARDQISICFISATLFRDLCSVLDRGENFPVLRFIKLRSEAALKSDVELFKKYFSSKCRLVHSLSSSETGTLCNYIVCRDKEIPIDELPIGFPAEGKEIYLLDDEGKTLGFNEVGEIVVRSRYLSRGYWRRPELTEAKFKSDPNDADTKHYRTGDLALMLPDGCLIHKGRKDFRVKLRGYGVDLKEVEKVLLEHPAIDNAAVVTWQGLAGQQCLAGYVVLCKGVALSVSDIKEHLKIKLPDYMIPAKLIFLNSLPLTNGKLDRLALPMPDNNRPDLKESYVAPRSDIERKLSEIWAEVLSD